MGREEGKKKGNDTELDQAQVLMEQCTVRFQVTQLQRATVVHAGKTAIYIFTLRWTCSPQLTMYQAPESRALPQGLLCFSLLLMLQ